MNNFKWYRKLRGGIWTYKYHYMYECNFWIREESNIYKEIIEPNKNYNNDN